MVMKYQKGIPIDSERRVMIGSFFFCIYFRAVYMSFWDRFVDKIKKE